MELLNKPETEDQICSTNIFGSILKKWTSMIKQKTDKGGIKMSGKKNNKYSNEFKQTILNLYNSGKTYSQIHNEYGISHSALANWIKQYSEVQIDDDTVLTARQIKELQKRNAQLEEENLILKKAIAIFTPHSDKD